METGTETSARQFALIMYYTSNVDRPEWGSGETQNAINNEHEICKLYQE